MSCRFRSVLATAALVILTLSGCGTASSRSLAAATRVPTPTFAAPPTLTPPPPCSQNPYLSPGQVAATQVGDLLLSPTFTAPFDGPDAILYQLPDGTARSPLQLPPVGPDGFYHGRPSSWPAATIGTSNFVYIALCNAAASTTHVLQSVRLTVTGFSPYTAQLNVWNYCEGYYARPAGIKPNSCDRGPVWGDASHQAFQVALPSQASVGTTVPATESGPLFGGTSLGPLPIAVPAGRAMYMGISVATPTVPGTYTLAVDLTLDGAELPTSTETALLLAPIAQTWSAQACMSAAVQALIPAATTPPSPYICPDA